MTSLEAETQAQRQRNPMWKAPFPKALTGPLARHSDPLAKGSRK